MKADHAGEFRAIDLGGGLLHDEVEQGLGDQRQVRGEGIDEAGERLDESGAENVAFAGQLILEMLGHGGGGSEQADTGIAAAQGLAEFLQNAKRLARPGWAG